MTEDCFYAHNEDGMRIKGFTLVELLVTISIIAILATIGISAYSNLQKSGRDAKRKSDLAVIQSALEQYHADQNNYPNTVSFNGSGNISYGSRTYLNKVPIDSITASQYCYLPSPNGCTTACTGYQLFAKLENVANGIGSCGGVSIYNYTVTPP